MRLKTRVLLIFGALAAAAFCARAADAPQAVVGYRGDRNGDYPGRNPPIVWDEATHKNLAWKTVLPNWCYGMPMVVGRKVFVMSEPGWKSDFPELVCMDLENGKLLWQRQIDHLEQAVPDAARRDLSAPQTRQAGGGPAGAGPDAGLLPEED